MFFSFILLTVNLFLSLALAGKGVGKGRVSYPPSRGLSGSNNYPRHNNYPHSTGLSGNNYASHHSTYQHKTEIHHHYNNYAPPNHINYGSVQHPVYHGSPPVYIYEYRNSGSRFDNLLTGLALYNLGRMSESHRHYNNYDTYRGKPGEICKLVISKTNGEYEETRIDCKIMSSFIWDGEKENMASTVTKTTSVQNITLKGNTTVTTVENTTIVDAIKVKGPSIEVIKGMSCFMIRTSRYESSTIKRKVDCALLQEYAQRSLRFSQCGRLTSVLSLLLLQILINYYFK